MAFEYAVALTGGIATGKSTVAKMFEADGYSIIDADKIAHEVLQSQHQTIATMFGDAVVKEGKVDRKALGKIVFADKDARKALEALLHPLIYQAIEQRATEEDAKRKPYIVDIPLFFEGGRYPIERVAVVYAPKNLQIARTMKRDGLSEKEVQKRLDAQMDIELKRTRADFLIDNSQDQTQLRVEYQKVKEAIEKEFA